jgi:hypothetical protein
LTLHRVPSSAKVEDDLSAAVRSTGFQKQVMSLWSIEN